MAYSTPKTDWGPSDAVGSTDFNRIESNIKALKDEALTIAGVKTFSGDNVHQGAETFNDNVTVNGGVGITGEVQGGSLDINGSGDISGNLIISGNLTIGGDFGPGHSPSGASLNLGAGSSYVFPRGMYMVYFQSSTTTGMLLEIFVSGAWRSGSAGQQTFAVISDGANVRARNAAGFTQAIYYLKY